MSRRYLIAGNWKMNKNVRESVAFARSVRDRTISVDRIDVLICPPMVSLAPVAEVLKGSRVHLGAQNCHWTTSGAFTGEVSADMVKSAGAEYVIVGHSERRSIFGETDEIVRQKMLLALGAGLSPIACVGEVLEERERNEHKEVVKRQVSSLLDDLDESFTGHLIFAYEPVWAIGTGHTATPDQAQEMHAFLRGLIRDKFSDGIAENIIILYGGSAKPNNTEDLLNRPDIDGTLIGGASLDVDSFIKMVKIAQELD